MTIDRVVRVAVANNFNCTVEEFRQLDVLQKTYPNSLFLVNSNIKTPKLLNLNRHPYQAVITANPDLTIDKNLVSRLFKVKSLAFTRVKWLPGHKEIDSLIENLDQKGYKVVVTVQRFQSGTILDKYADRAYYEHSYSRYRINETAKEMLSTVLSGLSLAHICDENGTGCSGCGLCASIPSGVTGLPLVSLNLSSSGLCEYSCPDCYAKVMQNFLTKCGKSPIMYDVIKKNKKQAGTTKHIKHAHTLLEAAHV